MKNEWISVCPNCNGKGHVPRLLFDRNDPDGVTRGKTAEEILIEAIVEYNSHVNNMSKFSLDKEEINMFTNCMKIYASQAIDKCAEEGQFTDSQILKLKELLK